MSAQHLHVIAHPNITGSPAARVALCGRRVSLLWMTTPANATCMRCKEAGLARQRAALANTTEGMIETQDENRWHGTPEQYRAALWIGLDKRVSEWTEDRDQALSDLDGMFASLSKESK